jgi:hypothetical protein
MAEAARIFAVDTPGAVRTISHRLAKRQDELLQELVYAEDWPDYRQRRGVLYGLQEAIQICSEIDKEERS